MSRWLLFALWVVSLAVPLDLPSSNSRPHSPAMLYCRRLAITVEPPKDAPSSFAISGKHRGRGGKRPEGGGPIPGTSYIPPAPAPRPTGVPTPFKGQPMRGFSGIIEEHN